MAALSPIVFSYHMTCTYVVLNVLYRFGYMRFFSYYASILMVAVAHAQYRQMPLAELTSKVRPGGCLMDIQSALDREGIRAAGLDSWGL